MGKRAGQGRGAGQDGPHTFGNEGNEDGAVPALPTPPERAGARPGSVLRSQGKVSVPRGGRKRAFTAEQGAGDRDTEGSVEAERRRKNGIWKFLRTRGEQGAEAARGRSRGQPRGGRGLAVLEAGATARPLPASVSPSVHRGLSGSDPLWVRDSPSVQACDRKGLTDTTVILLSVTPGVT